MDTVHKNVEYLLNNFTSENPYTTSKPGTRTEDFHEFGTITWVDHDESPLDMFVRHSDGKVFLWDDFKLTHIEFDTPEEALDYLDEMGFENYQDMLNNYWG